MKKLLLFFVVPILFIPVLVHASNDHLVINQIQTTGGPGLTANDFIEIFNPTSAGIDLNGMRLVKRTQTGTTDTLIKSWTSSVVIPPGGYYLWANSGFTTISVVPDVTTTGTIADDNGVALRNGPNDTGAIVDSVAWGSAANSFVEGSVFATNPAAGQAIVRTQGLDTDNNATDFSISGPNPHDLAMNPVTVTDPTPVPPADPTPTPSPDPTPTPDQTQDQNQAVDPTPTPDPVLPSSGGGGGGVAYSQSIVISEFLPNPNGTDSGYEWAELYNQSTLAVDISGWKLDDESSDGSVGSSAYTIPAATSIAPNAYLAIDLPAGSFALDNTGGDSLRLIWPNNQVSSQVTYTDTAPIDTSYARKTDGSFAWTTILTKGAANLFSVTEPNNDDNSDDNSDDTVVPASSTDWGQIKLDELFPNPSGPDAGKEWVEVKNLGTTDVTMHGWILDDGAPDDPIGSTAYVIQSPTVTPGGVSVIGIPAGKFAMNNSGTETVRLFTPDKVLVDSVSYSGAKESLSYAQALDGTWSWGDPTPNEPNVAADTQASVVINEVFPYPSKGVDEFIELLNTSSSPVDLSGWKLKDQNSSYAIPSQTLDPGQFLVIYRATSAIALANTAKESLNLINADGIIVSSLEYEDAPKDQSFNLTATGDYVWSAIVTPNAVNSVKTGQVAGATLVRTGNPDSQTDPTLDYFALLAIIWYIAGRVLNRGEVVNE